MMRGGRGKDVEKVMGPLFPRLHVNDAAKGRGPRAPPRNKMALYEQFSVPSQRFSSAAAGAHNGGGGGSLAPSTSASQVGRNRRPLFQPFFVSSNEPVCSSEKTNTNSIAAQADNTTRIESGNQSPHLMSKDIYAAGSIAECDLQQREDDNINNSSRKKTTNDEFMVPSIFCSGIPLQSTEDHVRVQEKPIPFCSPSPHMNGPALSKSSAKCAITDKKNLEGIDVSDVRARKFPQIKEKEPAQILSNVEVKEKSSSTQASKEKLGKKNPKASLTRDRVTGINVSDKPYSGNDGYLVRSRNEGVETHNHPTMRISAYSRPHAEIENINRTTLLEGNLRENGEKRIRSAGHHGMEQTHDLSVSSLESIPGLEISPDDVLDTIGAKHFWKARRAIVNQQRVFAVQVFELHRLTKVQKLIAASPHLLIEGDPCLGITLAASKNKLDDGNVKVQSPSAENKDDTQPTLPQSEYSKENPEQDQPSPSHDDGHCGTHHDQAATNGAFTNNLLAIPAPLDNKQSKWCHPPQNQWLVPVMSPSEGLVYKPCAGPCPPAGSFLAPLYANCTPLSLPSTAGDFMNSAYSVPIHLQPQHMAVPGAYPMHLNYFPPFSLPVMNPVASASVVEQVSHLAVSHPNEHMEQHSRSSCNMSHLRSEAFSGGIWRFHASRDSELQGSSASSPFERPQGEGRSTVPLFPAASVGNAQPKHSSGSWENQTCVIRVVPHNARTASESAAQIFRSIQMERRQNDS